MLGAYEEKRDFRRMGVDCAMTFRVVGQEVRHTAIARDLSSGGMLIECSELCAEGTQLEVNVTAERSVVPPLDALVEVIRVVEVRPGVFQLGVVVKAFR